MKPDSEVYLVYKYGYDGWEVPVGICSSLEIAEKLKQDTLNNNVECNISEEEISKMIKQLYLYESEHGDIGECDEDGLKILFPDKDPKDIEIAHRAYFSNNSFDGVGITKLNFYK